MDNSEDALIGIFVGCIFGAIVAIIAIPFKLLSILGFKGIFIFFILCAIIAFLLNLPSLPALPGLPELPGVPLPIPGQPQPEPPIISPPVEETTPYIVGSSNAIGREFPNRTSDAITTFKSGEEILVSGTEQGETVGNSNVWLKVLYENQIVYVHSSLATPKDTPPVPKPNNDVALLSPFNNGVTWTIVSGYYNNKIQAAFDPNNPQGARCPIGGGYDHCRNQLFGLDLRPDQQEDKTVLAPAPGKRLDIIGQCAFITLNDNVNLSICHINVKPELDGQSIKRGQIIGTRAETWVHLSLDDRKNKGNLCTPPKDNPQLRCFLPMPFNDLHTLEGRSFDPNHQGTGETIELDSVFPLCEEKKLDCRFVAQSHEWKGETGKSSNIADN